SSAPRNQRSRRLPRLGRGGLRHRPGAVDRRRGAKPALTLQPVVNPHPVLRTSLSPLRGGGQGGGLHLQSFSSHTSGTGSTPCRAKMASTSFMSAAEIDQPKAPTFSSTSVTFRHPTRAVLMTGLNRVQRSANCGRLLP